MLYKILERLQLIDKLISKEKTGNPEKLAGKIGISVRSIYDYLKLIKRFGALIEFDNTRQTYYYVQPGTFTISFLRDHSLDSNHTKK